MGGLWKFIQGQIGDLKSMVVDTIESFIIEKVIVSGITWILSLLNPASAFVRACKAIIDIIRFFIERASQIAELINAVIEAVTAIASGSIGGAAKAIENALSKSLPVVISFMASLLGISGISDKVQEVIKRVRQPIEKAINWVIEQAVKFAKKIGNKLGFGKDKKNNKDGKPDERTKEQKEKDLNQALIQAKAHLDRFSGQQVDEKNIAPELSSIKSRYALESLKPVKRGEYWAVYGKVNPEKEEETKARVAVPTGDLSDHEIAVIQKLPGGADLLSKLPDVNENKRKSLIQEARIALDAIQRGEPIEAIGKPIPRTGKQDGELTEIDVETENEIIQVKGGDYSKKKKLDDQDLRQMTETKRYRDRRANPKWHYFDSEGNELPTKIKKVVFHFTNPPVDSRLIEWLQGKDVEPRVGL
jgi:hypothetical protein